MPITFGILFKKIREEKQLSQIYMAEKLDVTQSYISQIECETRVPTLNFMEKSFHIFDCENMNIYNNCSKEDKKILLTIINKLTTFEIQKVINYIQKIMRSKNG
jgi:transcriptional regulator with XRE-family HTH domain